MTRGGWNTESACRQGSEWCWSYRQLASSRVVISAVRRTTFSRSCCCGGLVVTGMSGRGLLVQCGPWHGGVNGAFGRAALGQVARSVEGFLPGSTAAGAGTSFWKDTGPCCVHACACAGMKQKTPAVTSKHLVSQQRTSMDRTSLITIKERTNPPSYQRCRAVATVCWK